MQINEAKLIVSAPDKKSWPDTKLPEIVLAGRSNVGKSSLINTITQRKKLAYVGNTPGKTRLINFFEINQRIMLVDVPGYGYANASKAMLIKFGEMMEDYFNERKQKKGVVLIVDARHKPTEDDVTMLDFIRYYEIPFVIVATKIDKVKKNDINKNIQRIRETLSLKADDRLVRFSSETKAGVEELWNVIEEFIV